MVDYRPVELGRQAQASFAGRYYVLILLTITYGLNFLDRTIFNVLIEPIKKEFMLSDTMIGLIAGFGFVLFYSILGIPVARFADRANRRNIVVVALAFWSAMTMFCGMAQTVVTLTLARIGVGVGEAAGTPASQSMVSDLFSKNDRPRALGIYAVGTYLGVFLGYFVGGYINHHYGWRVAFISAGLPGLLIAAVLWMTVAEPVRNRRSDEPAREGWKPTLSFLAGQKTFAIVAIGFCLTTFTNYATSAWIPSFLARVHHLNSADIGTYAGTFKGLFGMAGTLVGGIVVAKVGAADDRWKLWAPAIMSALAGPVLAACLFADDFRTMVFCLGLMSFLVGFHLGPIFAIAQTVARPSMRALASAIVLLTATCFGQGVGPLAIGVINDLVAPQFGTNAIRYSLLAAALLTMLGAACFVWASAHIRSDIARAES